MAGIHNPWQADVMQIEATKRHLVQRVRRVVEFRKPRAAGRPRKAVEAVSTPVRRLMDMDPAKTAPWKYRLATVIAERKLSYREVGDMCGVARQVIWKALTTDSDLTVTTLLRLMAGLEISPQWLFAGVHYGTMEEQNGLPGGDCSIDGAGSGDHCGGGTERNAAGA